MRRLALLLLLSTTSLAQAQPAVAPITSLDATVAEVRAQLGELTDLLVGSRLTEPRRLHDLASLLDDIAVTVHAMATHAEHGQVTAAQRQQLEAEIEQTRLMLDQLSAQIDVFAPR